MTYISPSKDISRSIQRATTIITTTTTTTATVDTFAPAITIPSTKYVDLCDLVLI